MDLKTLADYRHMARFAQSQGENNISLDTFLKLLEKAEHLHQENQWLYDKLNVISGVIEKAREDIPKNV